MKRLCSLILVMTAAFMLTSCVFVSRSVEEDRLPHPIVTVTEPSTVQTTAVTLPEETSLPMETTVPIPESDDEFVRVLDQIPDMVVDLKYATTDNFTGQVIYASHEAWLRYGTVKKLMLVQEELAKQGLRLKLWDGFRPPSAQFKLWEICPDATYVSDPNKGFSSHSRGNTVDITLVDANGNELEMPTGFDDFSELADRDYSDCSAVAAQNAKTLEDLMKKYGFKGYYGEWWHYTDADSYDVEKEFVP